MFSHAIRHLSDTAPGALPYDAEVEYLEATGTQYIDTGVVGSTPARVKIKFSISPDCATNNSLFGVFSTNNRVMIYITKLDNGKNRIQVGCGTATAKNVGLDAEDDSIHEIVVNFEADNLWAEVDGGTRTTISGATSATNSTNLFLFNRSGTQNPIKARIYSATIWSGSNMELTRDYVSVRVGGEYCLYDKANPTGGTNNDGLYHNAGSGVFSGGSDKAKAQLPYDAEVEYIESTGTQWIDTGVIPNQNTSAQMRVMNLAVTGDVIFGYITGNDQEDWRFFNYNTRAYMDIFTGRCYSADGNFNANTWYEFEVGNLYVKNLLTGTTIASEGTLPSFTGVSTITLNKYSASTTTYSKNKWAWVKIYNNGMLVRDLIPVRVGSEYCLYDKANPTGGDNADGLYHNKGTGAFLGSIDKPSAGTKFLVSRTTGNSLGKIKPILKHYDIAVRYRIDERNDNTQTSVLTAFPSGKYTALNYTPTWAHHKFVGWTAVPQQQDAELEFLDSLPTGWTKIYGGNIFLTGVVPGPNTSFEVKARALNANLIAPYNEKDTVPIGQNRWGCDETINGVRTQYGLYVDMGGWSSIRGFQTLTSSGANNNSNNLNFQYKSTDIGVLGYDASTKTMYTQDLTSGASSTRALPDETAVTQFTHEFKLLGCPATPTTSAISDTTELFCRPCRLYYAKFWENGVLTKHFVPYRKNGVICLWEKVGNTFLYNYGNGILKGGPEVTSSDYVTASDSVAYDIALISARWQSPTTVTFDATTNGGAMPSGWTSPDYYEGQPYGTLPTPTHATLNFTGWYINGSKVKATDLVQANATLVAQYAANSYSVDISNGDWELESPNTNPDTSAYDGVYRNSRYWNSPPGTYVDKLYITVIGYTSFTVYIRSNAEVNYSYTVAVKADYDPTSFNDAISNKQGATSANNTSTAISGYTAVTYTLDGGSHTICIVYGHKDNYKLNDDRGYLLIPKVQ